MAAKNFSKISGVLFATIGTSNPKSYINTQCSYQFSDDNSTVLIIMGLDSYSVAFADLQINGATPANVGSSKVMLNGLFGT